MIEHKHALKGGKHNLQFSLRRYFTIKKEKNLEKWWKHKGYKFKRKFFFGIAV
jgi:hypothetical protein